MKTNYLTVNKMITFISRNAAKFNTLEDTLNDLHNNVEHKLIKCEDDLYVFGETFEERQSRRNTNISVLREKSLKNEKVCVIILDSPHIEEFENQPYLPAAGKVGENIHRFFSELVKLYDVQLDESYTYVIMNAIEYQCSLGVDPKEIKSSMFVHLWNNGGMKHFTNRLKKYSPSVILNLCSKTVFTVGETKKKRTIQGIVDRVILNYVKNADRFDPNMHKKLKISYRFNKLKLERSRSKVKYFYGNHPSRWLLPNLKERK